MSENHKKGAKHANPKKSLQWISKKKSHATSPHIFIIGHNFQISSLFVDFMDKQK